MKILELPITQSRLDKILAGKTKFDYRPINSATSKKLVTYNDELTVIVKVNPDNKYIDEFTAEENLLDFIVEEQDMNAVPIPYEAIRFIGGINKSVLITIKNSHVYYSLDEEGRYMFYKLDGCIRVFGQIEYWLDEILEINDIPVIPRLNRASYY